MNWHQESVRCFDGLKFDNIETIEEHSQSMLGKAPTIRQWTVYSKIKRCRHKHQAALLHYPTDFSDCVEWLPGMFQHFSTNHEIEGSRRYDSFVVGAEVCYISCI